MVVRRDVDTLVQAHKACTKFLIQVCIRIYVKDKIFSISISILGLLHMPLPIAN